MASASDNFNRANGAVGANWTSAGGSSGLTIVSNQAFGATNAAENSAYWNAASFLSDQHSEVVVGTNGNGGGPAVRIQSGTNSAYYIFSNPDTGLVGLWKKLAGSFTQLDAETVTVAPGDTLRLEVNGTSLTGYRNGTPVLTTTDSSISGGAPGILTFSNVIGFDSWSGGGDAAPTRADDFFLVM